VSGAAERVSDRLAAVQPERGLQAAVDLGDQHRPRRDGAGVEIRERLERWGVGLAGYAKDDRHCQTSIDGL
jgi:hypothetical protein